MDVGTNAEIVLGDARRLLAASSPTGPAFEGAQISSGQRAAPGAIERVRIDRETLEPRFRVIGSDALVGRAGLRRGDGASGVTGICGSGIVEVIAELYLAGVITADGIVDGRMSARSSRVIADGRTFSYLLRDGTPRILVTQNDVRAIQLAKAALYAGVRLLMDHLEIETVDQVRLAGAFGSQIDPLHAMVLGLIPDCDLEPGRGGRQCGRDRRPHRPPVGQRPARDRDPGAARGEDRDRRRAALPGALRGRHGHPSQDGRDAQPLAPWSSCRRPWRPIPRP